MVAAAYAAPVIQQGIAAKVRWRLALPCILFMLMSSLDRANISFAAARMNADLGFSPTQYGFGAGILFVGFLGLLHMEIVQQRLEPDF